MQTLFSHLESNGSHQAVGMVFMSMTMTNTAGGFVKYFSQPFILLALQVTLQVTHLKYKLLLLS